MKITPRIEEVKILKEYLLYIKFCNGEEKIYNMENLIKTNDFYKNLKNKDYFYKVKPNGVTVQWPNGEDVCPENLYFESVNY